MPSVRVVFRARICMLIKLIAGHKSATALIRGQIQTDVGGYVITVTTQTYTSVRGVCAAGDVQNKCFRQLRAQEVAAWSRLKLKS